MIHYLPLPDNIDDLLSLAFDYLRSDEDILFAYLFGSLSRKKAGPLSDVDIAVYCREGASFPEKKMEFFGQPGELPRDRRDRSRCAEQGASCSQNEDPGEQEGLRR